MNNHYSFSHSKTAGAVLTACCVLLFAGCASQQKRLVKIKTCPGKSTVAQAIASVKSSYGNTRPIKAGGICKINFNDKKQEGFNESFPIRIWYNPPNEFCMFGEILFDQQALCFAVNADEFWSYSKHFDVYYWGKTSKAQTFGSNNFLGLRPQSLLQMVNSTEAIKGVGRIKKYGPFDVLIAKNNDATFRKIYIDCCTYLIKRIEYVDFAGAVPLSMELSNYKNSESGKKNIFPHKINMSWNSKDGQFQMKIKLNKVNLWQPKQQQLDLLFSRPEPTGFKNVFKLANDKNF